jgi:phage terminase large subunit GpA-like protein
MAKRASARGIRRDVSGILRAPRRMPVADAVRLYARANGGGKLRSMGSESGTLCY